MRCAMSVCEMNGLLCKCARRHEHVVYAIFECTSGCSLGMCAKLFDQHTRTQAHIIRIVCMCSGKASNSRHVTQKSHIRERASECHHDCDSKCLIKAFGRTQRRLSGQSDSGLQKKRERATAARAYNCIFHSVAHIQHQPCRICIGRNAR